MEHLYYIWKTAQMKLLNSKFGAFLFIMLLSCFGCTRPMSEFVADVKYPVSWCLFPFLLTNNAFLILFWFGIVYINTDIPFMQYSGMYQIIRTGRRRWALGHAAGILIRSFFAAALTALCCMIPLFPHIEWTNEWGKVLRTLAVTDAGENYSFSFSIYYDIFNKYSPLQLMGVTIIVLTLISALLGMVMFVIALYVNRTLAVAVSALFCLMFYMVLNVHIKFRYRLALFIPTIWAKIAESATPVLGHYWMPPLWYMLLFLGAGISICTVLVVRKAANTELNWVNEDC